MLGYFQSMSLFENQNVYFHLNSIVLFHVKDVGSIVKYLRISQLLPPELTKPCQPVIKYKGTKDPNNLNLL